MRQFPGTYVVSIYLTADILFINAHISHFIIADNFHLISKCFWSGGIAQKPPNILNIISYLIKANMNV